jgi:hypothetical protein
VGAGLHRADRGDREEQLRDALRDRVLRLERLDAGTGGFAVVLVADVGEGDGPRHVDIDAERAYARALLSVLPG